MKTVGDSSLATILLLANAVRNNQIREKIARRAINGIIRVFGNQVDSKNAWAFISQEARKKPKKVVRDHAVPVKVLVDYCLKLPAGRLIVSPKNICLIRFDLKRYFFVAKITQKEDKTLTKIGLRQSMPKGWCFGDNPFARYKKVGIIVDGDSLHYRRWRTLEDFPNCYRYDFFVDGAGSNIQDFYTDLFVAYYDVACIEITPTSLGKCRNQGLMTCSVPNSIPFADFDADVKSLSIKYDVKVSAGRI